MSAYDSGYQSLQTINPDTGEVPDTRMKDPRTAQDYARRLIQNDQKRDWKRAKVNGLVDGNPPYSAGKLREVGRAEACNVNWGIARAYLESAVGAFYDLFSQAPGYFTIRTDYGTDEQKEVWSNTISEEADRVLRNDKTWDYSMQISQWELILHGCGPFLFEDAYSILPRAFHCGDLKLPELTKSETTYWDGAMLRATYYPPELYKFIENEEAATAVGWDVEYTKKVIASAMDVKRRPGVLYDWEFYQQELKNNALYYMSDDTKVCRVVYVFWKEFDGRITQAMVEEETTVSTALGQEKPLDDMADIRFLYRKIGRYNNWQEVVHPMYFDHGNGGYHHSVTGLGVKMYSAMEYENRLICNLCDKAFAPKILFKPTTTDVAQKFQLAVLGDYGVLPVGFDFAQTGVAGLMNDGLAMHQTVTNLVQSNLSAYRQQVATPKSGNPVTKYEKQLEASQQSALNMTQFNRYYQQLDLLYAEIYRRLSNLNTMDDRAKEFQKRCKNKGVPPEALGRISVCQATRVVGQGSAFMRKQAIDSLFSIVGSLPEDGRTNLINDKIASEAGQSAVNRYNPKKLTSQLASDQQAEALQWVASMKVGVTPVVTSSQNAVTYSATFLNASQQALNSLKSGANPMEVVKFLDIAGPSTAAQLQRIKTDPTRQEIYKVMMQQWEQIASLTDQLKQGIQKQQEAQAQQQQATQQALSNEQIKEKQAQADIQIKATKTSAQLQQAQEKHQLKMAQGVQSIALKDAQTASQIRLEHKKVDNKPEPANA